MLRNTYLTAASVAVTASAAMAVPVPTIALPGGMVLNVEGVVGSGANTSYEVIDFADTGGQAYAWEYKYDTPVTGFQMVENISAADPALVVTSTYYPEFNENFVDNFAYGSDSGNVNDFWRYLNGTYDSVNKAVDWTDSDVGANDTLISNGSFDGWYNSFDNDNPPRLPQTPTPVLTWNNTGGTGDGVSWDISGNQNWNDGAAAAVFVAGDNVTFNDANNLHYAVTLNSIISPGLVVVNNSSGNYTLSGSGGITGTGSLTKMGTGMLTLNTVNTFTGGTTVSAGTLVVGVNGALPNGDVSVNGTGTLVLAPGTGLASMTSLSIAGNGVLDVKNNHIILSYGATDPIGTIAGYLTTGYAGGAWNGPGINSSAANGNYGVAYADGADGVVAGLTSGQIEIAYALYGDVNLDGVVNATDLAIFGADFGKSVTGWDQGDFTYDGLVGASDFALLGGNFGKSASGSAVELPSADYAALKAFAAANGLTADVPEPGVALTMTGLICALTCRKRRDSRRLLR